MKQVKTYFLNYSDMISA